MDHCNVLYRQYLRNNVHSKNNVHTVIYCIVSIVVSKLCPTVVHTIVNVSKGTDSIYCIIS